jgi:hypothetical protein
LVAFAVLWEPFGGASASDVFVEFGLGVGEYRCPVEGTDWTHMIEIASTRRYGIGWSSIRDAGMSARRVGE